MWRIAGQIQGLNLSLSGGTEKRIIKQDAARISCEGNGWVAKNRRLPGSLQENVQIE
jgi:hypothetical protein